MNVNLTISTPGRWERCSRMRVLITGSSGLLGSTIASQISASHETVGIDIVPGPYTRHVMSVNDGDALPHVVRGVDAVIHTVSLHQPHVATHSRDAFIATNVTATLDLLEAAAQAGVRRFVYTSTTSVYGHAMQSRKQAVWVTEALQPRARDIYDHTKLSAEQLCRHFALNRGLPTICLRVARFFPQSPSLMAVYRLYRGVDVRDVAAAHVLALTNQDITFDIFNISARSPFHEEDMPTLLRDAPSVIREREPEVLLAFARHGWHFPTRIDRVYVIGKAERLLGYHPTYNFWRFVQELSTDAFFNS
jgi:UDP-glucose 4-epimerase